MTPAVFGLSLVSSYKESFICEDRHTLIYQYILLLKNKPNEFTLILEGLGINLWMKELKFHQLGLCIRQASAECLRSVRANRDGQSSSGSKACFGKEPKKFRCFCWSLSDLFRLGMGEGREACVQPTQHEMSSRFAVAAFAFKLMCVLTGNFIHIFWTLCTWIYGGTSGWVKNNLPSRIPPKHGDQPCPQVRAENETEK